MSSSNSNHFPPLRGAASSSSQRHDAYQRRQKKTNRRNKDQALMGKSAMEAVAYDRAGVDNVRQLNRELQAEVNSVQAQDPVQQVAIACPAQSEPPKPEGPVIDLGCLASEELNTIRDEEKKRFQDRFRFSWTENLSTTRNLVVVIWWMILAILSLSVGTLFSTWQLVFFVVMPVVLIVLLIALIINNLTIRHAYSSTQRLAFFIRKDERADAMALDKLKHTDPKLSQVHFSTSYSIGVVTLWTTADSKEKASFELVAQLLIHRNIEEGMSDEIVAANLNNTCSRIMTINQTRYEFLEYDSITRASVFLAYGWYKHLQQRQGHIPFPRAPLSS